MWKDGQQSDTRESSNRGESGRLVRRRSVAERFGGTRK